MMVRHNDQFQDRPARYRVQVGHAATLVDSVSAADAIRQARSRLCQEMPRLWDVIHALEESRFQVEVVQSPDPA